MRLHLVSLIVFGLGLPLSLRSDPGLAVTFRQGNQVDRLVLPYPALYVASDKSPTLFLEGRPFAAEFDGFLSVDLRAQYTFTIEANVPVELQIGGKSILQLTNTSLASQTSKPIRLSKGTNSFLVRVTPAEKGPASFRVLWSGKNNPIPVPIPPTALSHIPETALKDALAIHNGAFLIQEYRCNHCHAGERPAVPDAPLLAQAGSRLNAAWITGWILNPHAERSAKMPKIFHGPDAVGKAEAIAACLAADSQSPLPTVQATESLRTEGEKLFRNLHCASCHSLSGEPVTENRIPLDHVGKKFVSGALPKFLENPQAHYPSNPMPNFRLASNEANALAAFVLSRVDKPEGNPAKPGLIEKGKSLLQSSGCLNCHATGKDLQNSFRAKSFAEIRAGNLDRGCLAVNSTNSPEFALTEFERNQIKSFLSSKSSIVRGSAPHEMALHQITALRCADCHKEAGMADPLSFGGKLKPEWTSRFIAGEIHYKPRPWLTARMPAFSAYANSIAEGLAALHANPPITPSEPPPDSGLATLGARFVSANGGFSCVACHAVGSSVTAQIVESPGINLAYSGERLLEFFFHRWVMNPIAIDPATKMPVYFDSDGRSQLTEFFGGDAARQIDAIWNYIRLGSEMPPPPAP